MENEKLFEFMEKMYGDLTTQIQAVKTDLNGVKSEIQGVKSEIQDLKIEVKKNSIKLEELDKKVDLSLEGHKTNTEQLNRIEKEVVKHDEFILKRVK